MEIICDSVNDPPGKIIIVFLNTYLISKRDFCPDAADVDLDQAGYHEDDDSSHDK